jgi:hypothetical protein
VLLYSVVQFDAEDSSIFSTLVVAAELGLPDLQHHCESFISNRLNVNNACLFLAGAFKMESDGLYAIVYFKSGCILQIFLRLQ